MLIPKPKEVTPPPPPQAPPAPSEPLGKRAHDAGVLMMVKEFNTENVAPIITAIIEHNLSPNPPDELTLYINSPGGEVSSCFQLVDVMKQSRIPVNTIASGQACSCGFLTLMAGVKRYATENAMLMSHQYSWGSSGKEHDLQARKKAFDLSSERMLNHYMKCTKKSKTYIRKHLLPASDVFMSAEEAVKHNAIDEVITIY